VLGEGLCSGSGEAPLASTRYAEQLIDGKVAGESIADL
jgi:hypothetical protein